VAIGVDATRLGVFAAQSQCRVAATRSRWAAFVAADLRRRARALDTRSIRSADGSGWTTERARCSAGSADALLWAAHAEVQRLIRKARNSRRTACRVDAAADGTRTACLACSTADRVVTTELICCAIADEERGARAAGQHAADRSGANQHTDKPQYLAT
jgi:hypothetical protein